MGMLIKLIIGFAIFFGGVFFYYFNMQKMLPGSKSKLPTISYIVIIIGMIFLIVMINKASL